VGRVGEVWVLDGVLADLGLSDSLGPRLVGNPRPPVLASPLAVAECAIASVAACLTAASDLAAARNGRRPDIALDTEHVAAAMRSEVWLRDADVQGIAGLGPLSRLWRAADGWRACVRQLPVASAGTACLPRCTRRSGQ
jgi:hypothetical protein